MKAPATTRGSTLVAAGILLSRLSGLVRERVFAHYLGASLYADVLRAGLRIPNLLQNMLGEGTLSASFVPVYAELLAQGKKEEAGRVAGAILALLFVIAGVISLLGVVAAPTIVVLLVPGFTGERFDLSVRVVRILFPMTGTLVISAWALGILNSHRHFFVPYVAPVLWNAAIIGALAIAGFGHADEKGLLLAASWGALLGGGLQLIVQLPAVWRLERDLLVRWNLSLPGVREAIANAGPAILGRGVVQLSAYVDQLLASLLAVGAVAALGYAQTVYLLPVSLFGMSVAAAELPELARQRAEPEELRRRINDAIGRVLFYITPSVIAFITLGDAIVGALFRTGAFKGDQTRLVWAVIAGYAVGMGATTTGRVMSSAFYALRDTATPARFAIIRVIASSSLGFAIMAQFEPMPAVGWQGGAFVAFRFGELHAGAAGLALGAGITSWLEWALLRRALTRAIGPIGVPGAHLGKLIGSALLASAVGVGLHWTVPRVHPIIDAIVCCGGFGVVYLGMTGALGIGESAALVNRVLRRFKR